MSQNLEFKVRFRVKVNEWMISINIFLMLTNILACFKAPVRIGLKLFESPKDFLSS